MRTLKVCVNCIPKKIPIGHVGENVVEAIQFDYSAWKTTYGEGILNMVLQRSPDAIPYAVEMTDGLYVVTSTDLEYQGAVRAQLVYNVTGNPVPVKKSDVFLLGVDVSLGDAGDIPDPWQSWLDRVLQASDAAQEAVEHYPKVENGYWYVWNVSTESWTNTGQKAQGEPGPQGETGATGAPGVGIASTVLNSDYTLTITLTDGTSYTTPSIRGATGNGIASTVLNSNYTLTITFTDGTSYTTPSIRGAQGIPGQDYVITSADYDEIAGRVDTMIAGERQAALDDIDEAKTNAVSDVTAEGTTQKGLVTAEGTTQKGLVTSEGTTQVGLVTAKGQEVIQSIPSDYSELSNDVSELKSDFTLIEKNKADIIINSASGAIASFADGANYPVKQTVFTINPVQSGTGDPSPTNIRPISGHTKVDAVRTGKNLLDNDNPSFINAFYSNATVVTASAKERMLVIPCKANTTYTFTYNRVTISGTQNARICSFTGEPNVGSNGTMMASAIAANNSGTFTTGANDAYIGIHIGNIRTTNISETISASMLELGSTASAYEPYSGQSVTYQLGQTVYAGTLTINDDGTGQIVSGWMFGDMGDLSFSSASSGGSSSVSISATCNAYGGTTTAKPYFLSDSFNVLSTSEFNQKAGVDGFFASVNASNTLYILSPTFIGMNYTQIKQYVTGMKYCAKLATQIVTPLTEQEVLTMLKGTNNVWHDANGDTYVEYRADTKTYVDGLIKEENTSIIAPIETGTTASQAYAVGKYFLLDGKFCKAKTSIASGATFTLNTNYEVTTIADELYTALHS